MSIVKIILVLFIVSVSVVDGRALRRRRQTMANQLGQDVNNFLSNGYNTIRNNIGPAIGSTVDRFSQNWDQYKQNFNQGINQGVNQISQGWDRYKQNFNQGINQGINQMSQGWNQFTQNFNPQYPYNNNYPNNQYGYNAQQYPPPMNYNAPPNMYQNYNGRQGNPYPVNNNFNGYGQLPRQNTLYYAGNNMGGQWNQNVARQQPTNGAMYANRRIGSRRK